jgi:hypothetical protein
LAKDSDRLSGWICNPGVGVHLAELWQVSGQSCQVIGLAQVEKDVAGRLKPGTLPIRLVLPPPVQEIYQGMQDLHLRHRGCPSVFFRLRVLGIGPLGIVVCREHPAPPLAQKAQKERAAGVDALQVHLHHAPVPG